MHFRRANSKLNESFSLELNHREKREKFSCQVSGQFVIVEVGLIGFAAATHRIEAINCLSYDVVLIFPFPSKLSGEMKNSQTEINLIPRWRCRKSFPFFPPRRSRSHITSLAFCAKVHRCVRRFALESGSSVELQATRPALHIHNKAARCGAKTFSFQQ